MIQKFIQCLKNSPKQKNVFNPWWQVDPVNDQGQECPKIRRRQLAQYLTERKSSAKYLLLGEAVGYQGGHFTGMAMTSERILLGGQRKKGIEPQHVFEGLTPQRTSKPHIKPDGFSEPTATIVWDFIINNGISPWDIIIWNAFPWHPFDPKKGYLSNRTPKWEEFVIGKKVLEKLMALSRIQHVIAVGESAYKVLTELGITCDKVRHPANGGATKFRQQMKRLIVEVSN